MTGDQKTLIKGHSSQYVKLNVGGRLFYTTIGTLTKHNDTMLSAMFSGRMEVLTDSEGNNVKCISEIILRNVKNYIACFLYRNPETPFEITIMIQFQLKL